MPHSKITSGRPTVTAEEIPSGQVDVATGVDTRLRRLENIVNNNFQELKRVIVTSSAGSEQLDDQDKESVGGVRGRIFIRDSMGRRIKEENEERLSALRKQMNESENQQFQDQ